MLTLSFSWKYTVRRQQAFSCNVICCKYALYSIVQCNVYLYSTVHQRRHAKVRKGKCMRTLTVGLRPFAWEREWGSWVGSSKPPPLHQLLAPQVGSGAEPQAKLNFVYFSLKIWNLVATIYNKWFSWESTMMDQFSCSLLHSTHWWLQSKEWTENISRAWH